MSWYRDYEIDILRVGQLYLQQDICSKYPPAGDILYTDGVGGTYWAPGGGGGGFSTTTLISTIEGLGNLGYISTSQLTSTVTGLQNQISSVYNYAVNTSNYFAANLPNNGEVAMVSLEVAGIARALTFSSIYMYASTAQFLQASIGLGSVSNLQTITGAISNLSIPQPVPFEWITFANTSNADSVLLRSQDIVNWTTSPSPFVGGQFNSLLWNGNYWLAAGTDEFNKFTSAKSYDGLVWTDKEGPFTTGLANSIAWNGSIWVATGLDSNSINTISVSPDGISWSIYAGPFTGGRGFAIAWNGSYWLTSGTSASTANTVATSVDGSNWTGYLGPNFKNPAGYAGIVWTGTRWVLTGSDDSFTYSIAYSPDGVSWTRLFGPFGGGYGTSVTWNGSLLLATGADATGTNTMGTSSDGGLSWTAQAGPFTGGYAVSAFWHSPYFLATGYGAASNTILSYSSNATSWTNLGTTFGGIPFIFATAVGYANYPLQTSLTVNSKAYISSLSSYYMTGNTLYVSTFSGTLNDAQTILVFDI